MESNCRLGERITRKNFNDEQELVTESNRVIMVGFNHEPYTIHTTTLHEHSILPPKEVDEWEIYHVERRYFRGEASIRMVERTLGIDCGFSHRYKFGF